MLLEGGVHKRSGTSALNDEKKRKRRVGSSQAKEDRESGLCSRSLGGIPA